MFEIDWVSVAVVAVVGLLLLVALWPLEANGRRLLKKWQVADPSPEQIAEAVRYLKRRRLLYPWLYVLLGLLNVRTQGQLDGIVVIVLVGTLLAELIALRPRRDRQRQAVLVPRGLFQVASPWVIAFCAAAVIAALVLAVLWDRGALVMVGIGAAALALVVVSWAAVVRPASGDPDVDGALRTRSVHVTAGLAASIALGLAGGVAGFVGLLMWIAMANTNPRVEETA